MNNQEWVEQASSQEKLEALEKLYEIKHRRKFGNEKEEEAAA